MNERLWFEQYNDMYELTLERTGIYFSLLNEYVRALFSAHPDEEEKVFRHTIDDILPSKGDMAVSISEYYKETDMLSIEFYLWVPRAASTNGYWNVPLKFVVGNEKEKMEALMEAREQLRDAYKEFVRRYE